MTIKKNSFFAPLLCFLLAMGGQQAGAQTYSQADAVVAWPFDDATNVSAYTATPDDAFVTVAVNTGDLEITGTAKRTADNAADGITFIKFRPSGSTQAVEWNVKPAAGLTFTPTKVSMWIQRFGTDAENGVTVAARTTQTAAVTLGNYTAPRANHDASKDKYAGNANYTNHVVIDLSEAQQAALATTDVFTLSATVGVGSAKEGGFSQVTIEGLIDGTKAQVDLFTLTLAAVPEQGGDVSVYPASTQYEAGSEVTLTATEHFGFDFQNWTDQTGAVVSDKPKFTYTVNGDTQLAAHFQQVATHELALTVDGTNDYMVSASPAPTVVDGRWMYEEGQGVLLTAQEYDGLVAFNNWGDGDTNSAKTITMVADVQLTAVYEQADIIAGWDFYTAGGSGRKADFYAQDNDADALNLVNTATGDVAGWLDKSTLGGGGYESFAGAAVNWRTGDKNGDVGHWHWQTKVNAEAFEHINVQFQMLYNYNAYQTYLAEYSLDGETWTAFGSITMTAAKQEASFSETLPADCDNQKALYIRMRADRTSNIDGTASANDGNALAMFFITGTPKLVDDGMPPVLVSTVPADGATGASAKGKLVLTFDERVTVDEHYGWAMLNNMDAVEADPDIANAVGLAPQCNGKTVTYAYENLAYGTNYRIIVPGGIISDLSGNTLADAIVVRFKTMDKPAVSKRRYDAVVENTEQLLAAIEAADSRTDKNQRFRIFVKEGTYTIPLYATMKTCNGFEVPECITFIKSPNISFIGESRDGTVITNGIPANATFAGTYGTTSKYDGIGNSDVFQLQATAQNLYWQDITVATGMEDARGRDIAIQDKGTRNIYKNVCLHGYQDTWTSNNDRGLYYFEGGVVRGRTDYMCGKGDIFWNGVELRQVAGGYAAVPSKPARVGWVYYGCTINGDGNGVDGNYTLGRPWGSGTPVALYINTRMNVVPSAIGWNEMSNGWPKRFAEYNSTTRNGSTIDLSGRKKTFGDGHANNPVLTAEEAAEFADMAAMFGDWNPREATEQAPVPTNARLSGNTITWDDNDYVLLWAIVKDGRVVDFTTEPAYTVDDASARWAVRAANEMGGLSAPAAVIDPTGIMDIQRPAPDARHSVFNMQGIRVEKPSRGLYIVDGKAAVIK